MPTVTTPTPFARVFVAASQASQWAALSALSIASLELHGVLGKLTPAGMLGTFCLVAGLGALLGAGLALYFEATSRMPRIVGVLCDLAVGGGLVALLFERLGIIAKMQGETEAIAQLAALGCAALGYGWVLLLAVARLVWTDAARRPWLRGVLALGGFAAALGLGLASSRVATQGYPALELAIHASVQLFAALSSILVARTRPRLFFLPSPGWWLAVGLSLCLASPLLSSRSDLHTLLSSDTARTLVVSVRAATDWDGDGYSNLLGGYDCAALDARIHAFARDVPDDGIDQDCHGGDRASVARRTPGAPPAASRAVRPSLVLITVDTLRADRMGLYGAARDTTPNLDTWAKQAVTFTRAYTAGGWTNLALPSMLRGMHPRRLSWTRIVETDQLRLLRPGEPLAPGERVLHGLALPLFDRHPMLQALLGRTGYRTAAVLDDGVTRYFEKERGLFPGFDTYLEVPPGPVDQSTTDTVLGWLESTDTQTPFFLWTHYFGTHGPDSRHPGLRNYGDDVAAAYDTEVAHLDVQLARLLARLDDLAERIPLVVVMTADHGEEFLASGRGHGLSLREPSVRIPLLVKAPGVEARVRQDPVSLLDVVPTLLARAGIEPGQELDGYDLLGPVVPDRSVRFETWRLDRDGQFVLDLVGASDGVRKVTVDAMRLDEAAFVIEPSGERDAPFTPRHEAMLNELYDGLGRDGPPRFERDP